MVLGKFFFFAVQHVQQPKKKNVAVYVGEDVVRGNQSIRRRSMVAISSRKGVRFF